MSDMQAKTDEKAFKAGMWYVVSNFMVKTIMVITTPIFTRLMSTAEYGIVQTFISWHTILLPIFMLNLTYSIGRAKLDFPGKLDEYIGAMQMFSGLFSFILLTIAVLLISPLSSLLGLTQIETLILMVYLLFSSSIFLYQNGYRYRYQYKQNIAIAWYMILATTLISLVFLWYLPGNKADLRIFGVILPTLILSLYFWGKSLQRKKLNVKREYLEYGLKISVPLILHTISLDVLSQSDRIFITKLCSVSDTALYSLAYSYGLMLTVFSSAVSQGWLPWFHDTFFAKNYNAICKNVKRFVIVSCYIGLACIAFAPEAIMILGGSKYINSTPCVPPIVLGVVCQYIYTHYVNIELHLKKTLYVSGATVFAAIFNVITNIIFIPKFGFIAAAYTTLMSYFVLMIIHYWVTKKILHINLYDDFFMFGALMITSVIAGIIMLTYDHSIFRYTLITIGFVSFLLYMKKDFLNRIYTNNRNTSKTD